MKKILRIYKKNLLQIGGLMLGYFLFQKSAFLVIALLLLLILLISPGLAIRISKRADDILEFFGSLIKQFLLLLTFIFVVVPLSLTMRLFKKRTEDKPQTYYIIRDPETPPDLSKMW